MGATTAFATVGEAMDMARAALGYLAAVDATQLAVSRTAWAKRYGTHPRVITALAAGELSESYGRTICQWTDRLPEKYRDGSDELLVAAAAGGLGLADLSALFAEMYERARSELPDEDPGREFADRGVRLETTWQGAGVMTGDLTPECAVVVAKVLDALGAPAGKDDDRTREQRYHDALAEAMRPLCFCVMLDSWTTPRRTGRKPSSGRACTAV